MEIEYDQTKTTTLEKIFMWSNIIIKHLKCE